MPQQFRARKGPRLEQLGIRPDDREEKPEKLRARQDLAGSPFVLLEPGRQTLVVEYVYEIGRPPPVGCHAGRGLPCQLRALPRAGGDVMPPRSCGRARDP